MPPETYKPRLPLLAWWVRFSPSDMQIAGLSAQQETGSRTQRMECSHTFKALSVGSGACLILLLLGPTVSCLVPRQPMDSAL